MARIEGYARELYKLAGLDAEPPPGGAVELITRLNGRDCFTYRNDVREDVSAYRSRGRIRFAVARGLSPERLNFGAALVLARLRLLYLHDWSDEGEGRLAGWLVAPGASRYGLDVEAIARRYCITETCAALRVCEIGQPGIVVTPDRVYRRGSLAWLSDAEARRFAERGARGVVRRRLTDEPGRVAIFRVA